MKEHYLMDVEAHAIVVQQLKPSVSCFCEFMSAEAGPSRTDNILKWPS